MCKEQVKTARSYMLLLFVITAASMASCKKTTLSSDTASLTVVNAAVGQRQIIPNFDASTPLPQYFYSLHVIYGSFSVADQLDYTGKRMLAFYNYIDTLPQAHPLVTVPVDLETGSVHSVFVTGTPAHPDVLFTNDTIAYYPNNDSTAGIRFVNILSSGESVNINQQVTPAVKEVSNLAYKGATGFIRYPATRSITSYKFEFRNAVTGTLINTYTVNQPGAQGLSYNPNLWLFKNNTLALIGSTDSVGTYRPQVILINNF